MFSDEKAIYIKVMEIYSTHIFVFWRKNSTEQITWPVIVFKVSICLYYPYFW